MRPKFLWCLLVNLLDYGARGLAGGSRGDLLERTWEMPQKATIDAITREIFEAARDYGLPPLHVVKDNGVIALWLR